MRSVATILTCFNRKDTTLACLGGLERQTGVEDTKVEIFLVDDGSTDGTGDAVREAFPYVHVIDGTGDLFWNRGMHLAWQAALDKGGYDFYFLLNDDTILEDNALSLLLDAAENPELPTNGPSIAAGATVDPESGELTYGAYFRTSKWNPMKMQHRALDGNERLDTMNCNAVLVPARVVEAVGQFNPTIHHSWGDIDLGFKATKAGFPITVPREPVGTCEWNLKGTQAHNNPELSLKERFSYINSVRGLNKSDWYTLVREHGGPAWPAVLASPYVKMLVLWVRDKVKPGREYS